MNLGTLTCALVISMLAVACTENASSDSLTVDDLWGSPTPEVASNGALYLSVHNDSDTDDQLLSVSSPRCGGGRVHLSAGHAGGATMAPATVADTSAAKGESLVMEPGGLHVMCMKLNSPLVDGEQIELVLEFEQAGTIKAVATVEDRS